MNPADRAELLEYWRGFVRDVAHSIPPSDFGSTRAINAMAERLAALRQAGAVSEDEQFRQMAGALDVLAKATIRRAARGDYDGLSGADVARLIAEAMTSTAVELRTDMKS